MDLSDNMDFNVGLLPEFTRWFEGINDKELRASIVLYLSLLEKGRLTSFNEIGSDIFEFEVHDQCWIFYFKVGQDISIIEGCFPSGRCEAIDRILDEYNGY